MQGVHSHWQGSQVQVSQVQGSQVQGVQVQGVQVQQLPQLQLQLQFCPQSQVPSSVDSLRTANRLERARMKFVEHLDDARYE